MSEFDYGTGRRKTLLLVPVSMPATALSKSTVVKWKITSPARPFR